MSLQTSVRLIDEDLWKEWSPNMEMLSRKSLISPELGFTLKGLDRSRRYKITLSIRRLDNIRYAIDPIKENWIVSKKRKALPIHQYKEVEHIGGVRTGEEWMSEPIMFSKLKLSTNVKDMHKYVPVLTMIDVDNELDLSTRWIFDSLSQKNQCELPYIYRLF